MKQISFSIVLRKDGDYEKKIKRLCVAYFSRILMLQGCSSKNETASYDMAMSQTENTTMEETTEASDHICYQS